MKFLMIVLAVHFLGEIAGRKRKRKRIKDRKEESSKVLHPAEFDLRE